MGQAAVSRGFRFSEEYDGWWMTTRYKALLHYAGANFVPPGSRIVTGIPLHIFGSQRAQQQISDVFRKALKAPPWPSCLKDSARAVPRDQHQLRPRARTGGLGRYRQPHNGTHLFLRWTISEPRIGGVVLGLDRCIQVAQKLSSKHQRQIDAYEVDWALREDKPIKIKGAWSSGKP